MHKQTTLILLLVGAWLILRKAPIGTGTGALDYSSVVGYTPAGNPTYPSTYYNSAGVFTGGGIYEGGPGGAPGTPGQTPNGDPVIPGFNAPDPAATGAATGGFGGF